MDQLTQLPSCAEAEPFGITHLRRELGLTQSDFGLRVGVTNKTTMSMIERGALPCPLRVALAIEALSKGRIDAGALSDDVRLSREAVHGAVVSCADVRAATGQPRDVSGEVAA